MKNGAYSVDLRPSNRMEILQPLLLDTYAELEDFEPSKQQMYDDTVDFGTDVTITSSPISTTSRHSVLVGQMVNQYIDNTERPYVTITLACGNKVHCAPDVLSTCPMILRSIQTDVTELLRVLPWSVHALVKRTPIWINASYSYGPRDDPRVLRHSTAHHEEGWLVQCARDRPEKARCIEIYSCFDYERMRLHWNGCGLLLHEFCHLIHQFCLGLDNPAVEKLYTEAYKSGKYEEILRRDWAGMEDDFDMAYALVDPKEFFAEMSVTYLSNGYHDLDTADKSIMEECSPPLLEPNVTNRVLRKHGIEDNPYQQRATDTFWPPHFTKYFPFYNPRTLVPKLRMVHPSWQEAALGRSCRDVTHCNKFYPFTRGQLRHHDPEVFSAMRDLWTQIAMYEDPEEEQICCLELPRCVSLIGTRVIGKWLG